MDIQFSDKKLEKECNDDALLQKRHGKHRAKLLRSRLAVMREADNLSALGPPYKGPYRCHELVANRKGQLSVDLDHPYRLIFTPSYKPPPKRDEGGLDWGKVTAITIIEIADTH